MSDERRGPGGVEPREPHDLEDAGPALRISEQQHPAGPAFQSQWGWGTPRIEGPAPDQPEPRNAQTRARIARRDLFYGGVGVAVLLLVAAVSFWFSGTARADGTLQALGIAFLALAAASIAVGLYLSRGD